MSGTFNGRTLFASVDATNATFRSQSGDFASVAVDGAPPNETFVLTLANPVDPAEATLTLGISESLGGGDGAFATFEWVSSSELRVEVSSQTTGDSVRADFDLAILVRPIQ